MNEPLKIWCRNCHSKYDVSDLPAYSEVICPECGTILRIPERFGRYLLEKICGLGGMSKIYRAIDPVLARRVAIKIREHQENDSDEDELEGIFLKVARMFANISHPHLVSIYDFGVIDNREFLVMPYLDGGDFEYHFKNNSLLPYHQLIVALREIAVALNYLHSTFHIVHHDVKPANIVLDNENKVRLIDFDLADIRDIGDTSPCRQTWGSPAYVSPERLINGGEDFRGDIFSLGATFYELLSGRTPFGVAGETAELLARRQQLPVALNEINPLVNKETAEIINQTLAFDPMDRPTYPLIIRAISKI